MMDKFTKLNKKCLTKASLIRISEKGGFSFLTLRCTTSCLATYLVSCSTVSGISFLSNSRIVIFLSVFASLLFASMIPFRSTPVVCRNISCHIRNSVAVTANHRYFVNGTDWLRNSFCHIRKDFDNHFCNGSITIFLHRLGF